MPFLTASKKSARKQEKKASDRIDHFFIHKCWPCIIFMAFLTSFSQHEIPAGARPYDGPPININI